jgi:DNA-directed RNA polymerase specialized sigma24 family protein
MKRETEKQMVRDELQNFIGGVGCLNITIKYVTNIFYTVVKKFFNDIENKNLYKEDLLNDILIKVIMHSEKIYKSSNLYSYIYSLIKNHIYDKLRRLEVETKKINRYYFYRSCTDAQYYEIDIDSIVYS